MLRRPPTGTRAWRSCPLWPTRSATRTSNSASCSDAPLRSGCPTRRIWRRSSHGASAGSPPMRATAGPSSTRASSSGRTSCGAARRVVQPRRVRSTWTERRRPTSGPVSWPTSSDDIAQPWPRRPGSSGSSRSPRPAWFVERWARGEADRSSRASPRARSRWTSWPSSSWRPRSTRGHGCYERALELFDQIGDRRGVMSAIIAMAYITLRARDPPSRRREANRGDPSARFADGVAHAAERARRWRRRRCSTASQVFARAKVVPGPRALEGRGGASRRRADGRSLAEFAAAGGVAADAPGAGRRRGGGAVARSGREAATRAPTPLGHASWSSGAGVAKAAAGDAEAMREHLERAVRLANEQGRPAAAARRSRHWR